MLAFFLFHPPWADDTESDELDEQKNENAGEGIDGRRIFY
jgi:hypothetical protein